MLTISEEREPAGHLRTGESMEWWRRGGSGPELDRRVAALRQVCSQLLRLQPMQRPRSMDAFRHTLRGRCTVSSSTLRPLEVAQALGMPDEVQELLPDGAGVETPDEEVVRLLQLRWASVRQSERSGTVNARFAANWVRSMACVRRTYDPCEIASALRELGLLAVGEGQTLDCAAMTPSMCEAMLPAFAPEAQKQNVVWDVVLPAGSKPAVIGKRGAGIRALQQRLQGEAKAIARLQVKGTVLRATLLKAAPECVEASKAFLNGQLLDIQRRRLERSQARRDLLQDLRRQSGREYH